MNTQPPRVFVSYSHDSEDHKDQVRELCTVLRRDAGLDVRFDQWADHERRDWSAWAMEQLREADFILAVASPAFKERADGLAAHDEGRGAQYESAILRDQLTRNLAEQVRRILPVVLPGRSITEIPDFLLPYSATRYVVDELTLDGLAELLGALTGSAKHPMPQLGTFVGNPWAELHATLQAEENDPPPAASTSQVITGDGNVNANNSHVNFGIANYGTFTQHGEIVLGDRTVHRVEPS